ncbi:MAG TPA: M48 family metallopeptidase [Rubricoccaceae bacterium]|nr:M48 family metallopeptidase [Rubricoccaceae bacterium]
MRYRTCLRAALGVALLALPFAGCATLGGANYVSLEQEWQMGQQIEAQLASELDLVNDRTLTNYVNRIGQQLVRQTTLGNRPWRFYVVNDDRVNAFNVPGGLVYVHTGLIARAGSAAELVGAMAHEVAHGALRHGTRRMSQAYEANVIAGAVLGRNPGIAQQVAAQVVATGAFARFSRADENEADRIGVPIMAQAGYDPEGLARMLERLLEDNQRDPGAVGRFFSTHPTTRERVANVRALARSVNRSGLRMNDGDFAAARSRAQRY